MLSVKEGCAMDEINRLQLLAELVESHCELNHGPGARSTDHPAADFLVAPLGYNENDMVEVAVRELFIPVCAECAQALLADEWTLLYCFECSSSRWVSRQFAKNHYRHHILWLRGCPDCTCEFGGLYFNEIPLQIGHPELLAQHQHLMGAVS